MKRTISLLLTFVLILSLTACGGGNVRADDKYFGAYKAISASAMGISMSADSMPEFAFELKEGGKGSMTVDGTTKGIKWSNDDENVTLKIEGKEVVANVVDDTLVIENMLDMGVDFTFAK